LTTVSTRFAHTEAAAQLLLTNTASRHLAAGLDGFNMAPPVSGMQRRDVGTRNIVKIVRNYNGKTFGFASRIFYVSFLAALRSRSQSPKKYFGFDREVSEARFRGSRSRYVSINSLERALKFAGTRLLPLQSSTAACGWAGQRHRSEEPITSACDRWEEMGRVTMLAHG